MDKRDWKYEILKKHDKQEETVKSDYNNSLKV